MCCNLLWPNSVIAPERSLMMYMRKDKEKGSVFLLWQKADTAFVIPPAFMQ